MDLLYRSTRNNEETAKASEAILRGLAGEGGLYVPERIPALDVSMEALSRMTYQETAYEVMKLTVRSYHKVLKVARTIADMEEKEEIDLVTLREALGYRVMDKEYWG